MSIVVGVDGSTASLAALRWAVSEAALRRTSVAVWHAWHAAVSAAPGAPADDIALESAARRTLDRAVGAIDVSPLDEPVDRVLARGVAASVLLDASRTADLLVIGASIGSVARQVLAHAACPVVLVAEDAA